MHDYERRLLRLSNTIDKAVREHRRLVLVIGNGCHYLPILTREEVIGYDILKYDEILPELDLQTLKGLSPSSWDFRPTLADLFNRYRVAVDDKIGLLTNHDLERRVWKMYEIWRQHGALKENINCDYVGVAYLLARRVVDAIITTNYDAGLETLFSVRGIHTIMRNPCLSEAEWDCHEHYSKQCSDGDFPIFWKIHGDLSYMAWSPSSCNCIYRIPNAAGNTPYHKESSGGRVTSRHYHDYGNFERGMFSKEITAAKDYLSRVSPNYRNVALIIAVGFTGHWGTGTGSDEELAPVMVNRAEMGLPVFTILADSGYIGRPHSYLWDKLDDGDSAIQPKEPRKRKVGEILVDAITGVPEFEDFGDFSKKWDRDFTQFQKEA